MKSLLFLLVVIPYFVHGESASGDILTDSMKKGIVKLTKNCMLSVGANEEELEALRKGPPFEGKSACILACILDKAGIMKAKKYSRKGFMLAVTPFLIADPSKLTRMREIATNCDSQIKKSEDECEAANHIVVCLSEHIPKLTHIFHKN